MKNAIIVVLVILLAISLYKINDLAHKPYMPGQYQVISELPDFYDFECRDDAYKLLKNGEVIDQGKLEGVESNIYLCKGVHKEFIISLDKIGFYLLIDEKPLHFKKVSDVPATL